MSSLDKLDDFYTRLFKLYKSNYSEYVDATKQVREEIKLLKPPQPTEFRPYPKLTDKNFNEKIAVKKEFARNKLTPEYIGKTFEEIASIKCSQVDFKLTNNQKFVKNFISPMTPYNGLLLFHGVGVGKTATAISIAEQYLNEFLNPKKVLIILSSNIKDNFKKQLFDITKYDINTGESTLCTGTKYPDMILDKDIITKDVLEKRINKVLKDRYQFIGYKELVNITQKIMDNVKQNEKNTKKHQARYDEKIKEFFSDRLIIVDEAHNLRLPSEKGKKQIANTMTEILSLAERTKLVLLTATPMYNDAKEIVWLLNLLLTNDKKDKLTVSSLFDKSGKLTHPNTLIKASRGYVSYMRGENPFSFPFRLYPSINKDKNLITRYPTKDIFGKSITESSKIKYLELIGSDMSPIQRDIYDKMKVSIKMQLQQEESNTNTNTNTSTSDDTDIEVDVTDDTNGISNELQNSLQLCNIVYPGDNVDTLKKYLGEDGFSKCFEKNEKRGVVAYRKSCVDKYGEILRYENLHLYSPKIKLILDYIINSQGIVFIYSQYYYSGIYPLAIALEHIGFKKYNTNNICGNITIDNKFKNRPSYIIISRDKTLSPNNDLEVAMSKSKANQNGEIIKVIIVSKVGTEGIDFKRIREVHILEPWFNLNRTEQIIGRAVRTCSHIDLPPEKRNVSIFMHALKYKEDEESIDLKIYRMAENKQVNITMVQRVMKENAIDCKLNIDNLIYDKSKINMQIDIETSQGAKIKRYNIGDNDYSYLCDYNKCEMKCAGTDVMHKPIDDTTFDPMFIVDDIDLYKKYISRTFWNIYENTYEDIKYLISKSIDDIDDDILVFALQEMLDTKYKFKNSKGNTGYLLYRGNRYIYQDIKVVETKLSLEERQSMRKKHKLDVDILMDTSNDNDIKKESIKKEKKKKKQDDTLSFSEYYDNMKSYGFNDKHIYDSIFDKLQFDDMVRIVFSDTNDGFKKYLLEQPIFIYKDGKELPEYVYNYNDTNIYSLKDQDNIKAIGPLEQSRISNYIEDTYKKLGYKYEDSYKGFIDIGKKTFKIRDNNKTKGFVCYQTSSLSVEELKQRINKLIPGLIKDGKYVKKQLCDVYELALRSQGDHMFKRPYHKN